LVSKIGKRDRVKNKISKAEWREVGWLLNLKSALIEVVK
jgi:hypothetical protein